MTALLLATAARAAEPVALHGRTMGTTWTVKYIEPGALFDREQIRKDVGDRLEQLEQQFSTYRPGSEISRFNGTESTEWIPVSREIAVVAALSRRISELTGGAFDATVAPLVQLWGFGAARRTHAAPSAAEIGAVLQRVGRERLEVRTTPPALRKADPRVAVEFASTAKGYAADRLAELLAAMGVDHVFVQIGGDVATRGAGPEGGGWRVGVEEPLADSRRLAALVGLVGEALSTSGDYRNFVVLDGKRYGHIIDPRTGRPSDTGLAAVSVVHSACAMSSALATALFVLGPEEGWRLAEREKLAVAFFVREGGMVVRRQTPEFARRVVHRH